MPVNVVAAIIKKNNNYLIVQRNKNKYMGLKWEFPGGKVENNESFKKALLRYFSLEKFKSTTPLTLTLFIVNTFCSPKLLLNGININIIVVRKIRMYSFRSDITFFNNK